MAYTNNPVDDTQSVKRFSFITSGSMRSSNTSLDHRIVNFLPEAIEAPGVSITSTKNKEYYTRTRPGLTTVFSVTNGTPRGVFNWGGHIMSVFSNNIYYDGTFLSTIGTSVGDVGFTEFLTSTGTKKLVLVDGTSGYVFTVYNAAPTLIASANFPTPHISQPIFLDGYLFLAKAASQDIYNSDLDDPAAWTAGNFISAEMYPDTLQALSKNNNYLYGIGTSSTEYFHDAGNATGTPLNRQGAAVQQFGTPAPKSVVSTDDQVYMIGDTSAGGFTVWEIDGFKADEIASTSVRFALNAEGAAISTAKAYSIRTEAQKLYIINLTSRTLVYSSDSKIWVEWSYVYPALYATDFNSGYAITQLTNGVNGIIAKFDISTFTDVGSQITGTITTSKMDFDTINRKRCDILTILSDAPNGANNVNLGVQWSDDDYQTFTTSRNLTLNPLISVLYRLGIFRRRAFRFTYAQPYPWRAEGMELSINKGTT